MKTDKRRSEQEIREKLQELAIGLEEIENKFMLEISPFSSNKQHQIELVKSVIQALQWVIQEQEG